MSLILKHKYSNHGNHFIQNLEIEPTIKKPIVANHTFFAIVTFSKINSFACINSIATKHLQNPFIKKRFSSVSK